MDECDESRDLFWHALNYRGAQRPADAQKAWEALKACVELLIQDAIKAKEATKQ